MFEMVGFLLFLGATVVGLVLAIVSGRKRDRRRHLRRALTTVGLLAITIVFAYALSGVRDFPPEEMAVHKYFSKSSAVLLLPVILTGWALWFRPGWRWAHRVFVALFLLVVLGAAVTGVWMLALSSPKG